MTEPTQQAGRRFGAGTITALIGLAVLLIFIIQNRQPIRFHFLFLHFTWPMWVYTIVSALAGAIVWIGLGVIRRHRRRVERRRNREL
jgi:uncharacterized integral membrane protein